MSAVQGHKHSASSSQNHKAQLANAYNELGKELSSSKIKIIGNYTLGRVIGEGTYGTVRLGTHRLTSTRVAIKQIPKEMSAALTREIHHHRRLHHPHVTKLYEVIATESHIWLVTELCSGGELFDYLAEKGRLSEDESRIIFGQLCLSVGYIHDKGVVHRDLKLENVLLDEHCRVKLGDFGFTREFERGSLLDTYCGTTGYAAPEMLMAKKYLGPEVDIWSLGIILHCLLTGSLPFDDDDESIMREKIVIGQFDVPEWLSEDAQDLIRNILQYDPAKRLTITQILAHSWFARPLAKSTSKQDINEETLEVTSDSAPQLPSPSTSESSFHSAASELHHPPLAKPHGGLDDSSVLSNDSEGTIRQKSGMKLELAEPTARKRANTTSKLKERKMVMVEEDVFLTSSSDISRKGGSRSNDHSPARHREPSPGQSVPPSAYPVRTPARTKRRSVSSQLSQERSPVAERHQPLPLAPQDYAKLLSTPAPLLFSTSLERQLLNSLNLLGFDIGQMVHSVLSDACDASGAIWWMLKRKAEKKAVETAFKKPKDEVNSSAQRDAETEGETEIEYGLSPSPGFPDSPAVEHIMKTIDQSQSAPELSLIPATPTIPTSQQDHSHSPPITPPRSKSPRSMLSPTPTSETSTKSNPSTPSAKDKESNQGSKGRSSGKPRSGSVSIVQRATTAALEAAGLVRKKSNEAVKEEKEKEKERTSSSIESKSGHSSHARLTKSPPLKPVKDTNIIIPSTPEQERIVATDLGNASPWVMPVARSSTFDVAMTPSNTQASGINEVESKQPTSLRNRNSILHTFRTWFNEERKGKRKASHPLPTTSATSPSLATIPASPAANRTSFRRGRGGYKARSKRVSVSSRRSSSVNSRRSSVTSMQMVLMDPLPHGAENGISRQKSDPSRRSFTPELDREVHGSRPSSIRSYNMNVRHKKSTSFGSTGSTARMNRAASPLNKYHHRAGSSSSTRAVRNIRHSKGSTSTPRPRHVRSNSATSSIQSSRPGSFYDASDAEGTRTGSPISYYSRAFDDSQTPRRSNSTSSNYKFAHRRHQYGNHSHGYSGPNGLTPGSAAATLTRSVSRTSWKKSWGTEPPGWRSRSTQFPVEVLAISPPPDSTTTIRDVFSQSKHGHSNSTTAGQGPSINLGDEDDWVDEDDDFPTFAGGLGQLGLGGAGASMGNAKANSELPQMSPVPRAAGSLNVHSHNHARNTSSGSRKASGGRNANKSNHSPTTSSKPLPGTDGVFDGPSHSHGQSFGHGHHGGGSKDGNDGGRMSRRQPAGRSGPAFRGPTKIIEEEEEEEE